MEIINLHKNCNKKARKVLQPKHYLNQMNLKKHQRHQNQMKIKNYQNPLMMQARKNRSLKKSMEKILLQRQEKKHQSHLNLLIQLRSLKKKDHLKMIKSLLCWGWKKKPKVFLIFRRRVKIWQSKKRWKRQFLWQDPIKVMNYHALHYVIPNTSNGCKNVRPRKENKGSDRTSAGKDLILFNPLHQPSTNESYNKNN